jgi:hypothetical protein
MVTTFEGKNTPLPTYVITDGMVKSSSDENQALTARTRKGKKGSLGRRDSVEREASP